LSTVSAVYRRVVGGRDTAYAARATSSPIAADATGSAVAAHRRVATERPLAVSAVTTRLSGGTVRALTAEGTNRIAHDDSRISRITWCCTGETRRSGSGL
jgi:hypothetical protein